MKKHFKYFILIVFCLFSLTFIYVKADSGWDTDYDSGYSSSSGSSSSSSGSNGEVIGDGKIDLAEIIFFIAMGFILYGFYRKTKKLHDESVVLRANLPENYGSLVPIDDSIIKNSLPNFNKEEFLENAYNNFVKLQKAWMEFNYDEMKSMLSDELFKNYKSLLSILNSKKQKNIMSDFTLISSEIVGFSYENNIATIDVAMEVSFYDYVVDKNNKVVRGKNNKKVTNEYKLTYIMKNDKSTPSVCPGCGAELQNSQIDVCEYCKTQITNNNHDWILCKKRIF